MQRRAFTIIELLIVIGIIVVLVGILIPTMGAVYTRGYKTRTQGTMNDLQAALATYYSHFHSYPGPVGPGKTTASSAKVSGAQNLLLGLSYSIAPASLASPPINTIPTLTANSAPGVTDFSTAGPDGSHPQLTAFFAPVLPGGGRSINAAFVSQGVQPSNTYANTLPVVLDAYSDALPILYYRRTPGANAPAGTDSTTSPSASYYLNDNIEYTSSPNLAYINSKTGSTSLETPLPQTSGGLIAGSSGATYLSKLVSTDGTSTGSPHGGYMLLSAGTDRIYGTSDDIVMVAGD